jgi:aspartyl-tRNA(Asn)/glutamyl-tRNA(Gln) amidotransferase subunit B
MPYARIERYKKLGIAPVDAEALVATRELSDYFEEVAGASNPKAAANWVRNEVLRFRDVRVPAPMLARLINMIEKGAIGSKVAKEVFEEMTTNGEAPDVIVERRGLSQIADPALIRDAARRVLDGNPTQVAQYRGGKAQVFGFLVGQLMKETRGKANAELANAILRELLDA